MADAAPLNYLVRIACALALCSSVLPAQVPARNRLNDVAINAAIGGVVGAAWAAVRRTDIARGFGQGVAGGVVMSAGRQTTALTFHGAGFVGRETSAIGTSLIASVGKPKTTLTFPFGPFSLQYSQGTFDWRLHLMDLGLATATALSSHTRLDWALSLESAAPVFRVHHAGVTSGSADALGVAYGSVVWLRPGALVSDFRTRQILGHENVHVAQDDFVQNDLTLPIEAAVIGQTALGRRFLRHFDLGILGDGAAISLANVIPYSSQPWEREAYGLEAGRRTPGTRIR
jgi:hypothetical protein